MARKKFPLNPPRPDRNCWGCDLYCAADKMVCGNGSDRTQHPAELFGPDWAEWGDDGRPPSEARDDADADADADAANASTPPAVAVHKSK